MTLSEYPGNTYVQQTTFLCFSKAKLSVFSIVTCAGSTHVRKHVNTHMHSKGKPGLCFVELAVDFELRNYL